MKNVRTGAYIHNDEIYDFSFGTDLSVADKARFTNSVVSLVIDDKDSGGKEDEGEKYTKEEDSTE